MAAERDEVGTSGPGLSGTGRDHEGLEAGTTRSMSMGDAPGGAEVHAGIAFSAEHEPAGLRGAGSRVKDVAGTVAERAGDLGSRARSVAGDVGHRAGELASQVRTRVSGLADRATTALEDRGMLEKMRENPLPALGIAFAVGFLLAGGGSRRGEGQLREGKASRARSELRHALLAGVSAGLAQGARNFLRHLGAEDSVVNEVLQNLPGLGGPARGGGSSGGGGGGTRQATTAGRGGGSMAGAGSGGTHRPPSHQENL